MCIFQSPQMDWIIFKVSECMLRWFSSFQLFKTLWAIAHQAPLSMGFSRQDNWGGLPCPPPNLPDPGIKPTVLMSPALAGGFFTPSTTWEVPLRSVCTCVCVCVCACVCVIVTQSCLTLCDPMDYNSSGSPVHGILQERIWEWVAVPFSRGSSQLKDQNRVSHIARRFFTIWATPGSNPHWIPLQRALPHFSQRGLSLNMC